MYGIADNNGNTETHKFVYLPVRSGTGKIWLNNNLGAEYADTTTPRDNFNPAQQATSSTDKKAYGSLFQWGRKADGHELRTWKGVTTGVSVSGSTATKSDAPTHALFINGPSTPFDWRITQDDTLWKSESSTNNVCPVGYRLPTEEWEDEVNLWHTDEAHGSTTGAHAIASSLKLSYSGYRRSSGYDNNLNGKSATDGWTGYYWSATSSVNRLVFALSFSETNVLSQHLKGYSSRGDGYTVRCIKDE
jgi:uncharacterized protein (TIGR02145 family)